MKESMPITVAVAPIADVPTKITTKESRGIEARRKKRAASPSTLPPPTRSVHAQQRRES